MAGEDRQQFARDAHKRMLDREADAATLEGQGRKKQAQRYRVLAARQRTQRDRYDDAGEFSNVPTNH